MSDVLTQPPRYLRSSVARLAADAPAPPIERTGGLFKAGVIRGVSVITRGEALGHEMWIDDDFVASVADAVNASEKGIKARFTHPGLSGDGLGRFLGRVIDARVEDGRVIGDLHFSQAAHKTPDGDLATYVMDLAESDPQSFGVSIVFEHDQKAEAEFDAEHIDDDEEFQSPDPLNTRHLPHVRLAELRAADVVDDPAANPKGLFHRQDIAHEADALVSYALGLSTEPPKLNRFDVHPDRVSGFVKRFLDQHGLQVVPKPEHEMSNPTDTPAAEPQTEPKVEVAGEEVTTAPVESQAEPAKTQETEAPAAELAASPGKRYLDAFGDKGGVWFAQGLSFEQAQAKYTQELEAENKALKARVQSQDRGADPVQFQAESPAKGKGLAGLVKFAGRR